MAVHHSSKCKPDSKSTCDDGIDLAAIDKALGNVVMEATSKRPKGFTAEEYADKKGIARRTAREHLTALYKKGFVERALWRHQSTLTYVYRMTDGTKR